MEEESEKVIALFKTDDVPIAEKMSRDFRKSYMMAINNGLDDSEPLAVLNLMGDHKQQNGTTPALTTPTGETTPTEKNPPRRERTGSTDDTIILREKKTSSEIRRFHTVCYKGERKRKRFSINGHFYDGETSIFTPAHGTVTTVRVNSLNSTTEVIQSLLDKFKVENRAEEFCLVEARRNGEMRRLLSTDCPLLERVLIGPEEDDTKIFLMDAGAVNHVSQDVNQYASLPDAVLRGFLGKLSSEETEAMDRIRDRFARYRDKLQKRLDEITQQSEI